MDFLAQDADEYHKIHGCSDFFCFALNVKHFYSFLKKFQLHLKV